MILKKLKMEIAFKKIIELIKNELINLLNLLPIALIIYYKRIPYLRNVYSIILF